ncbi:hypothetical protein Cob_v010334 [Colletotrichum orbiculare MAFF 240422]|uniref:Uncharacterized protein n=1 Tax=Colletotrichum orbiculare (strain 104-T / ATCC 96160 / CBS 514.97 / LARS 414 / MAFF 240422) TaxID=1213857 RepID=A0A484FFI0_COLOR|nr:hypothetical protein Cob_v010334 [Colletotrichum orbiculare MAFF 240422]
MARLLSKAALGIWGSTQTCDMLNYIILLCRASFALSRAVGTSRTPRYERDNYLFPSSSSRRADTLPVVCASGHFAR